MTESWAARLRREARETHEAVDALLASPTRGAALRAEVEAAARLRWFSQASYRWGPWLWRTLRAERELRVALRPLLLARLDGEALDREGRWKAAFSLEPASLGAWLDEADAAGDVEVVRRLLPWKLAGPGFERAYREALVARFRAARTPSEQRDVLARFDFGAQLDEPTACEVYEAVGPSSAAFVLARLPWSAKDLWQRLFELARARRDDDTAYRLYREQASPERWAADVRRLGREVTDPAALLAALEKHHPRRAPHAGKVLLELARARGDAVVPYVAKHASAVFPRWGWLGRTEAEGLPELVALAEERGWWPLWGRLLQTAATPALWNKAVEAAAKGDLARPSARRTLALLSGAGREANFPGFGLAQVQPLSDPVACLVHERAPELLCGPLLAHLAVSRAHPYPKLVARALAKGDEDLLDFVASRTAMDAHADAALVKTLCAHYEALPTEAFLERATSALSRMPAYAVWHYGDLLRRNALARLFFERSTPLWLDHRRAVRELLESPQIHVQALALRVLATPDPRAGTLASSMMDLLAPTLLRPLHRRTRLAALAAIRAACLAREEAAAHLVPRMRDALALPDRRYPKEALVATLGAALHRWPSLRRTHEAAPVGAPRPVYRSP